MKRTLFALVAVGLFLAPSSASAQVFFDNYCVSGSFQVCSSVRVSSSANKIVMQVWNLEGTLGSPHTITSVGLYHSGDPWMGRYKIRSARWVTETTRKRIAQTSLRKPNDIAEIGGIGIAIAGTADGGKSGVVGCTDTGLGNHWATCNSFPSNPYLEVEFELTSGTFALENLDMRFRSVQLPDDSKVICDTGPNAETVCAAQPTLIADTRSPTPVAVVPEPVSSVLLLSGLAGMAGARAVKRRRLTPEATEPTEEV